METKNRSLINTTHLFHASTLLVRDQIKGLSPKNWRLLFPECWIILGFWNVYYFPHFWRILTFATQLCTRIHVALTLYPTRVQIDYYQFYLFSNCLVFNTRFIIFFYSHIQYLRLRHTLLFLSYYAGGLLFTIIIHTSPCQVVIWPQPKLQSTSLFRDCLLRALWNMGPLGK